MPVTYRPRGLGVSYPLLLTGQVEILTALASGEALRAVWHRAGPPKFQRAPNGSDEPTLQTRKLRLGEVQELAQGSTAI